MKNQSPPCKIKLLAFQAGASYSYWGETLNISQKYFYNNQYLQGSKTGMCFPTKEPIFKNYSLPGTETFRVNLSSQESFMQIDVSQKNLLVR